MSADRPQYGEYATPEEQRRAAGLPPVVEQPVETVAPAAQPAPVLPDRPGDRLLTIMLLAFGLVYVVMTVIGYQRLPEIFDQTLKMLGSDGEFTSFAAARTWGTVASVVLVAGYVLTAWLAIRRVRARRVAWWIPIVGAVATFILVSICMSVPMMSDPAFLDLMKAQTGR
ncbi:DUF6264 family protein [Microbacterium sp.]|uniref:DUF6264 family protein n=1 Tax=Microbacterium sp. TaxID=51671 RepID=UPI00334225B5